MRNPKQPTLRFLLVLAVAVVGARCGSDGGGGDGSTATPATVSVTTTAASIKTGGFTARAIADVRDANGHSISASVTWSSSDAAVASVAPDGVVTSGGLGAALITATVGDGVSSSATIQVVRQPNPRCTVPGDPTAPGAIAAAPTFLVSPNGFDAIPVIPYDTRFLIPADVDGDRHEDLVHLNSNATGTPGGTAFVYRNDGAGHFGDATAAILGGATVDVDQPSSSEVGDLNGDGRADLFVTQQGNADTGSRSLLFASAGASSLSETGATAVAPNASNAVTKASASADVECDGDLDLVASAIGPTGLTSLLINDGIGTFQGDATRLPAALTSGSASFTAATACDIDRDGDPEIIGGGWNGSSLQRDVLLLNDGFGNYLLAPDGALPSWHFPAATNVTVAIRCADLDLDGYPDLIVSQTDAFTRGYVTVLRNQQNRTFAAVDSAAIEWPTGWVSNLSARDFNADGWPDLVVSGFNGNHASRVYTNTGGLSFTAVMPPRDDQPLVPIEANGDALTDLVAPETAGAPTVMLNGVEPPPSLVFRTEKAGDRLEIPLGPSSAASGHFHFEAKGFVDEFKPRYSPDTLFIYFWLYSGDNFYYKGAGEGFLYIPSQYAMTNYTCNYGKVRGRSNTPGEWPLEACYQYDPWDGQKWYSFDIRWDGTNIAIYIDGKRKHVGSYGSNSLPLIAGFGFPPAQVEESGIVGMEFRNWSFTQD